MVANIRELALKAELKRGASIIDVNKIDAKSYGGFGRSTIGIRYEVMRLLLSVRYNVQFSNILGDAWKPPAEKPEAQTLPGDGPPGPKDATRKK